MSSLATETFNVSPALALPTPLPSSSSTPVPSPGAGLNSNITNTVAVAFVVGVACFLAAFVLWRYYAWIKLKHTIFLAVANEGPELPVYTRHDEYAQAIARPSPSYSVKPLPRHTRGSSIDHFGPLHNVFHHHSPPVSLLLPSPMMVQRSDYGFGDVVVRLGPAPRPAPAVD